MIIKIVTCFKTVNNFAVLSETSLNRIFIGCDELQIQLITLQSADYQYIKGKCDE